MVLAHLAVGVSDEFVTVVELDSVPGVGQHFEHLPGHFNEIFFCHKFHVAFSARLLAVRHCGGSGVFNKTDRPRKIEQPSRAQS